jgi:hypothetical protein
MQFAKDSFFLALQERLAAVNPARVVTVNGTTIPAVVAVENIPPSFGEAQPDTFYLEWGSANLVARSAGGSPLMSLDVVISYYSRGSVQSMVDRGRVLAQLDDELLSICEPPNTEKRDYTQAPSADLGTTVFWNLPSFGEGVHGGVPNENERHHDGRVERKARMTIYFFSEVMAS